MNLILDTPTFKKSITLKNNPAIPKKILYTVNILFFNVNPDKKTFSTKI